MQPKFISAYLTHSLAFVTSFIFTERNSGCAPGERWLEWRNLRWLIETIQEFLV